MRIATIQFTPKLGDVKGSIAHAEDLLYKDEARLRNLDLLILPELALTGMYFSVLKVVSPAFAYTAAFHV